jgi:hypothetical protein
MKIALDAGPTLTSFMAECFWPGVTEPVARDAGVRGSQAAVALSREGAVARYLGSVLIPTDEIALYFFEATSRNAALDVAKRAAIPFERVIEVVRLRPPASVEDIAVVRLGT